MIFKIKRYSDVHLIARKIGLKIFKTSAMGDNFKGICLPKEGMIFLSDKLAPGEDSVILAHEIGHYMEYFLTGSEVFSMDFDEQESWADLWAEALYLEVSEGIKIKVKG